MGILCRGFKQVKTLDDVYYSSAEMSVGALQGFVDLFMYKALGWLMDEKFYNEARDICDH
jgi:hypothetical protein